MKEQEHIEEISLANVYLDRETQVRATVSEETVQRYQDAMENEECRDKFPPIILYRDNDDTLWLADGHHRVMAANRRKFQTIHAIIRKGSKADAIWEAIKANGRNGLPLGRADIRRAVEMVIKNFPERSNRSLADAICCSEQMVRRLRESVAPNGATERKNIGKDGKLYPAKKQGKKSFNPANKLKAEAEKRKTPIPESPKTKSEEAAQEKPLETVSEKPLETTVESQSPAQEEQAKPADNSNIEKANAVESQIMAMLTGFETLLRKWFELAPSDQHEAFDLRCRKRITEIFG